MTDSVFYTIKNNNNEIEMIETVNGFNNIYETSEFKLNNENNDLFEKHLNYFVDNPEHFTEAEEVDSVVIAYNLCNNIKNRDELDNLLFRLRSLEYYEISFLRIQLFKSVEKTIKVFQILYG